jgi:hypothetical protein
MSDLIKGLRYFHVCSMGTCKSPGLYPTKNGDCFCKKCVVKYVGQNGLRDFWPHGLDEIIEIYNHAISIQENENKERLEQRTWEKYERDMNRPTRVKSHRKK